MFLKDLFVIVYTKLKSKKMPSLFTLIKLLEIIIIMIKLMVLIKEEFLFISYSYHLKITWFSYNLMLFISKIEDS